ncbi:DUF3048 domain-containing protein [Butyrivibrio sp. INlla16]|uniref:DUF3048 domain-containing protein n=1 Tax=Butyrivibrio sp. INlla16 TaxID=1520807 RepID=UPI000884FD46|nr:DUF3048 domain-containing protein [Butyrivibrio sp. INlla16]SDB47067.1 Protein of unknown function [Butyrivibrio sp. INlla16]
MKFNKRIVSVALTAMMLTAAVGCGKSDKTDEAEEGLTWESIEDNAGEEESTEEASVEEEPAEEIVSAEIPAGMYRSELTGEPISESLKDQRPIAVMVDNESAALPHFGTAECDVVYEMMNSTQNGRITRLMCMMKDWGSIKQLGSIRSTRPTNIILAAEWNAVLCHDGGPKVHIDPYLAKEWGTNHFSGTFSRVDNGKKREYTEYILSGDLENNFSGSSFSTTYNEFTPDGVKENHFNFTPWGNEINLQDKGYAKCLDATTIDIIPFTHNSSKLVYNEETKEYEYYDYGNIHKDGEDGEVLSFKNVILQKCTFNQLDDHGYLIYNCIDINQPGYYCTNGKATDIVWTKTGELVKTQFFDSQANELEINNGKTYIALVPADTWDQLVIQ